jgi:hypothetical protein
MNDNSMEDPRTVTEPTLPEAKPEAVPAGLPSEEFQFDVLHAIEGYCARLPDGRLCLLFGDATRCVGVTLGDGEMVSQLHTALAARLVRPAGATLH